LAIKSHSQQKAVALKAIAKNGHVFALDRKTTFIEFGSVGINEASTFKGFCSPHDAALFSNLELKPLVPGDPDQIREAFLRATAHECVRKLETGLALATVTQEEGEPKREVSDIWLSYPEIEQHFLDALKGTLELGWVWAVIPQNLGIAISSTFDLPKNNKWMPHDGHQIGTATIIPTAQGTTHLIVSWPIAFNDKARHLRRMLKDDWAFTLNAIIFYRSEDYSLAPELLDASAQSKALVAWHTYPPFQPAIITKIPAHSIYLKGETLAGIP